LCNVVYFYVNLGMNSFLTLVNNPLQKTLTRVNNPIQHAQITVFYYVFLMNIVKVGVLIPGYIATHAYQHLSFSVIGIAFILFIINFLLAKPEYLNKLIHLVLIIKISMLIGGTVFYGGNLTLLTIQDILMVCMWSFYALKDKWGFHYAWIATIPLFYPIIVQGAVYMPLGMSEFSYIPFIIVLLINFFIIFFAHYFYSNFLYDTIESKEKLYVELEDANKKQTLFFSNMSHELRTPLNVVIGMANLLIDGNNNKEQKENLDILKFSAENLLSLINDILDLNKLGTGHVKLEAIPFQLKALLDNACAGLRIKAIEKDLYCRLVLSPDLVGVNVLGDPTRLLQIVFNLVGNGIKFTKKGGVEINVRKGIAEEGKVLLHFTIKDTGIGMSAAQQQHVFNPFTQADGDTTRKFGGTGLGLSIVKQLLSLHQSEIVLTSEQNAGATFAFDLEYPLAGEAVVPMMVPRLENPDFNVAALKIMLAEDNRMNILFMKKLLGRWGITLDVASNGIEVMEMMERNDYDLILMDIQMPVMNGYETTKKIRALPDPVKAATYIIALTASVAEDVHAKVVEAGMNDTLSKPFKPEQLYEKLQYVQAVEA
jgi:signal transduction histidine kinase/CheY-like chemotaxis protein